MSQAKPSFDWRKNALLFGLTVWSVFATGRVYAASDGASSKELPWHAGWTFAVPLLLILLAHEFGHYVAARIHRVSASLPYFLPLPAQLGSPFGTLGAVILMPGRVRSARALLDIGAAGPLAGMLVAVPTMVVGLKLSHIAPRVPGDFLQEGESLLYMVIKRLTLGPVPATHDVFLHPTAFAAWAGFFVTFLNLLPFMQLDGGHVAYALFGTKHDPWSRRAWWVPAAMLVYNAWTHTRSIVHSVWPLVVADYNAAIADGANLDPWDRTRQALSKALSPVMSAHWSPAVSSMSLWLMLLVLLVAFRRVNRGAHPAVDDSQLGPARRAVAIGTLLLAVLLFMPSPLVVY
jgi:membrane-associated protease RseP (regulator of RpoE activity)